MFFFSAEPNGVVFRGTLRGVRMFERFNEKAIKAVMMAQEDQRRLKRFGCFGEWNQPGRDGWNERFYLHVLASHWYEVGQFCQHFMKNSFCRFTHHLCRWLIMDDLWIFLVEHVDSPYVYQIVTSWNLSPCWPTETCQESRRLGHNYVGTEMLLVGVVADTSGPSGKVLKKFNVTLKDILTDYQKIGCLQFCGNVWNLELTRKKKQKKTAAET